MDRAGQWRLLISLLLILLVAGCSTRMTVKRNYYILEYYPHTENKALMREEPFDYAVFVRSTKIPNTYDRREIVIRHFGPRITYAENNLWGVDLSNIIPDLIAKRLNRYHFFSQVKREFLDSRPDFEVDSRINNIELFESEFVKEAHLNMEFMFRNTENESIVLTHAVNREEKLADNKVETFVQMINEIILEETDLFLAKIARYFQGQPIIPPAEQGVQQTRADSLLLQEDSDLEKGRGLLLMPALSGTDYEPPYKIYDQQDNEIDGVMGKSIPLPAGTYSVKYGSGSERQMMQKTGIEVRPRYKTIVEPDWGCLLVDVIDERRDFVQVRYEVFSTETGESYGTELTVEKELGEQQKIWLLRPQLYKITINSEPFNTYRDFATIKVEKGKVQKLTMVVGVDEEGNPTHLIGAGQLEGMEELTTTENWHVYSGLYGNFNYNQDNEKDKDNPETSITVNTQFDNRFTYDNHPFYYTMRNLTEIGTSKSTDTDFRISTDDFDLKNTFIFFVIKNLGIYARLDANSHFFKEYYHSPTKFNYIKINKEGQEIEREANVERVQLKSSLYPMVLKEGSGINYRILNFPRATLNLRAGFGLRQEYNYDVFNLTNSAYQDTTAELKYRVYTEDESIDDRGTELSIVGNFQLPFDLIYSTNADILFPFDPDASTKLEWENVFNIRLFKYISLDYRLKLRSKDPEAGESYLVREHRLYLRLTYFFR